MVPTSSPEAEATDLPSRATEVAIREAPQEEVSAAVVVLPATTMIVEKVFPEEEIMMRNAEVALTCLRDHSEDAAASEAATSLIEVAVAEECTQEEEAIVEADLMMMKIEEEAPAQVDPLLPSFRQPLEAEVPLFERSPLI